MKRLISIGFWACDIVFYSAGYWLKPRVNFAQNSIAIFDVVNHNAQGYDVINLVKPYARKFAINAVNMLKAAGHFPFDI